MIEDLSHYNAPDTELRRLQLKMLDILIIVADICDKHNLPYWISGGTLLGAKRHGGFIPWDDDIDIELLRKDYKKLLKILPKELPNDLYLQTPKEKSYRLLFSKVRDKKSTILSDEENMANYQHKGLFIDIFSEERSYPWLKSFVDFFYGRAFRRFKRGRAFQSFQYFYEYAISLILLPIGHLLKWMARGICALTKPPYILHSYGIGNTTIHKAEYMFPTSKIKFEGRMFSAPQNIDLYLKTQYGDYMSIPKPENRPSHFTQVTYH